MIEYALIARVKLTPAQQDYLEACHVLSTAQAADLPGATPGVRVTDLAEALGTRLPTVSRSIARLRHMGLIEQRERGPVYLTELGRAIAEQLLHRHEDVTRFLTDVLGVDARVAEDEACVIEHGLSGGTAQRLHEFLDRWDELEPSVRRELAGLAGPMRAESFTLVGRASGAGRRR